MIINIVVFITLILLIVLVTRELMIKNIRKLSIYLSWNNGIVGSMLGYATSTPELINAIVSGSIGMIHTSIYNVLSSNIINLLFVIVLTTVFKRWKSLDNRKFEVSYLLVIFSILMPAFLIMCNASESIVSVVFLVLLYLVFLFLSKHSNYFESEEEELEIYDMEVRVAERKLKKQKLTLDKKKKIIRSIILIAISITLLYILGNTLGDNLENLGKDFKISQIILGTIMGVVTSLPELMTFISSYKRHRRYKDSMKDKGATEVINNLVTSNISNLCIVQTVAVIVYLICT